MRPSGVISASNDLMASMNNVVGRHDKSAGSNAWKPHYRQDGFVHSFQSYHHSPVFGATANKISTREPLGPLGHAIRVRDQPQDRRGHKADIRLTPANVRYWGIVAKLFAALRSRNNRIRLSSALNQCCVLAFVLKSILLVFVVKIVLQHIRGKSGHSLAGATIRN